MFNDDIQSTTVLAGLYGVLKINGLEDQRQVLHSRQGRVDHQGQAQLGGKRGAGRRYLKLRGRRYRYEQWGRWSGSGMKELLLQLTILLLSVGFLWDFGLIKTTSDNEDMNLFLDLTVESWGPGWGDQISDSDGACSGCQPQLSKEFSPNLSQSGSGFVHKRQ